MFYINVLYKQLQYFLFPFFNYRSLGFLYNIIYKIWVYLGKSFDSFYIDAQYLVFFLRVSQLRLI